MLRILVLFCLVDILFAKVTYEGHQVWRVKPDSKEQLGSLKKLGDVYQLDFWKEPTEVGSPVDFKVSPNHIDRLQAELEKQGTTDIKVLIHDVESLIAKEIIAISDKKHIGRSTVTIDTFDYTTYHPLDEINEWVDLVVAEHKEIATKEQFGVTYQGRPMYVLKIEKPSNVTKPIIFVDSLIHSREWITTASLMFIFKQMLKNPEYQHMIDKVDWYFVPVINIDGYVETWIGDRLWRKTRSTGANSNCSGVDANRNWNVHWSGEGASSDPCSIVYHGPTPESESEIRHLSNYILGLNNIFSIDAYISTHSYSQFILYPYNYANMSAPDEELLNNVGNLMKKAIYSVHGTDYTNGPWSTTLYISSGTTTDWTYEVANIKLSYTVELRDTGNYGFLLPADQIIPTGEEYLAALETLTNYVAGNF